MHDKPKVTIDLAEYNALLAKRDFLEFMQEIVNNAESIEHANDRLAQKDLKVEWRGEHFIVRTRIMKQVNTPPLHEVLKQKF